MHGRLLFTGAGGAGNEAIYRLWQQRYELFFADADPRCISRTIPTERRYRIPLALDPTFAEELAALCRDLAIDVLVPGVDEELPAMPRLGALAADVAILAPDADFVRLAMDKLETARALAAHGLPAPETGTIADLERFPYPCIAKPRTGRGSRGFHVLESAADAAAYLQLSDLDSDGIVLQERLVGREFSVMMAADRFGRLGAVVPVEIGVKRGITLIGRTRAEERVLNGCRALHARMPTSGCYNVQLILTEAGDPVPFEINPRISTTFCLGVAAGVDPVKIYTRTSAPARLQPFRDGLEIRRQWTNVIE